MTTEEEGTRGGSPKRSLNEKADLDFLGVNYDHESCEDIYISNVGMPTKLVKSNSFV